MVTHYSINGLESACGRSSDKLVSTALAEGVSCKTCQRSLAKPEAVAVNKTPSLAELRKSAKAAKMAAAVVSEVAVAAPARPAVVVKPAAVARKPAEKAAQPPARSGGFCVKSAWAARLGEQPGRSRLPRGKKRQAHV